MTTEARTNVSPPRPRARTVRSTAMGPLRVGDVLGGYRLCVELGSGGVASVYLAHGRSRSGVHKLVAIKCIRPELAADAYFGQMVLDEAFLATQLPHPHVCDVLEVDQH